MSNKSRLQTNNTNLQALIDKANALPDASGSSGGGTVTNGKFTVTYNGATDEPGIYQYYFTSEDLHLDNRTCIIIFDDSAVCSIILYRDNVEEVFQHSNGPSDIGVAASNSYGVRIDDLTIALYGDLLSNVDRDDITFKAW